MSENTPCIRCGKIRVLAKSWTENHDGNHSTTYTQTVCPDAACQKMVEQELEKRSAKIAAIQAKSLEKRKSIIISRRTNPRRSGGYA